MKKVAVALSSTLAVIALGSPFVAFASTMSNSSTTLTQAQLANKSYVQQLEQQSIQNYINQNGATVISGSGVSTQGTMSTVSTNPDLQNHVNKVQKELQDPSFQKQLTQQWESQHASGSSASQVKSGALIPNSVPVPTGSWEVETTYDNDPGLVQDADKEGSNYSEALTIAEDIGSFFLSSVGNVAMDIVNLVAGAPGLNKSEPITSIMYHNYDYGYKDLYIYNGAGWVDCFTTEDREWYRHEYSSYIATNNQDYTSTYDFIPANGYSYVHQDHGTYFNDSQQSIYNEGVLYYNSNEHGYDEW